MKYVNFHCHSTFSILDAIGYVKDILSRAKEIGMKSVAITDHGNLNSLSDLYILAPKYGIKPIYGIETYFINDLGEWEEKRRISSENKELKDDKKIKKYNHLILLAKNEIGLKNLFKLNYDAYKYGFYYKPRIDKKTLTKYKEGLICSTACLLGPIQQKILEILENSEELDKVIKNKELNEEILFFKELFQEDFYLEIQLNELPEQKIVNKVFLELSKIHNIKIIITCDNHYITKEQVVARDVMMAVRGKTTIEEYTKEITESDETVDCRELYLKSAEELLETKGRLGYNFISDEDMEQFFKNTLEIDNKIQNIKLDTTTKLIKPKVEGDSFEYLKQLCEEGFEKLVKKEELKRKYRKRLEEELSIIKEKEIYDYLLLTKEIIDFAEQNMLVGVGRGSAAGSLVCYLVGITKIDPIKYGLLFGRFISLNRKELPDIDTDFEDPEIVKQKLIQEYGEDNVAYVSTYSVYQMKSLLKDYCRVFNVEGGDFLYSNDLTKRVEEEIKESILTKEKIDEENEEIRNLEFDDYLRLSNSFKEFIDKNKGSENIVKTLYSQIRQIGKHPAGTIVVEDLNEKMPLQIVKGKVQTSYTEGLINKNLSKMGFVKFDLLGLGTLKIINDTLKLISETEEEYKELVKKIHPANINELDENVYKHVFHNGNFAGIFQFSETQMREISQKVKPCSVKELGDIVAIVRPGPLQNNFHITYMDRKNGLEKVKYLHPILEEVTKDTYGLLIYQEQIMQTSVKLAGMSEAESNDFRKVISKIDKSGDKNKDLLELKEKFLKGAIKNGCKQDNALEIWEIMRKFSGYAFNLSHSICYAMIAFQCSFLKTYYPREFYCALLTNTPNKEEVNEILSEMENNGIQVCPPNINISEKEFTVKDGKIFFGLRSILSVGDKAVEIILKKRPYSSIEDYLSRTKSRAANKKVFQHLVYVDAFKEFAPITEIIKKYPELKIYDGDENIFFTKTERELIGYNISFKSEEEERRKKLVKQFLVQGKVKNYKDITFSDVNFYGRVIGVEKKKTKTGKDMLKLRLEDEEKGKITAFMWEVNIKKIEKTTSWQNVFYPEAIICFKGKVSSYNGMNNLTIDTVYKI